MGLLRKLLGKLHKKSVESDTFIIPHTPEIHENLGDQREGSKASETFVVPSPVELGEKFEIRPPAPAISSAPLPTTDNQAYQDEFSTKKHNLEIEQNIIAIQRSTKVTFQFLAKIHNYFRQKYSWYYKWHLNPFASLAHTATVIVSILLVVAVGANSLIIRNPKDSFAMGDNTASNLLGQVDGSDNPVYTTSYINGGANSTGMSQPSSTVVDANDHRLFVSDYMNNRVLVYNLDGSNNLVDYTADYVLGQVDFANNMNVTAQNRLNSPRGLAYDSVNKRLFVSDYGCQRIMIFDVTTITNGQNAIGILGQTTYGSCSAGTAQNRLYYPYGVAYDSTNSRLFVGDYNNHRIMVYDVASVTNGENAVNILGKTSYTDTTYGSSQNQLYYPSELAYDDGASVKRLFVADRSNHRVMVFDVTTISDGENAINVLGQTTFSGNTAGNTQGGMNYPYGVAFDQATSRLFVSGNINHRITVYDVAAITDGENAINVLGQTTFTASSAGLTQAKLNYPCGISFSGDKLYTADQSNNRVMVFDVASIVDGEDAVNEVGQLDGGGAVTYTQNVPIPSVNDKVLYSPRGTAIDSSGHRLFVSDSNNSRILVYNLDSNNLLIDRVADYVLGQSNFTSRGAATTQTGLSNPNSMAFDAVNNRLFVADTSNQRIIVYDVASITNGEAAIGVIGQTSYTTRTAATTQAGLNNPYGVSYDSANSRLFVTDYSSNRVVVYDVSTIDSPENAINVLGQTTFTGSGNGVTQSTLYNPRAVLYDGSGKLYVADYNNYRVMVYDVTSISDGENAVNVLGQSNFTNRNWATTQAGMTSNWGFAYDSTNKRLFVSDFGNHRIMIYDVNSITDGENAINVIGQNNYTTGTSGISDTKFWGPTDLTYDSTSNMLYVPEYYNNRVMVISAGTTRYWVASSTGNWSDTANWSYTSGGVGGATVPGAGDSAIFDGAGSKNGNVTLTGNLSIDSFDVRSGYTGTITQGAYTITTATLFNLSGGQPLIMGADVTANGSLTIGTSKTLDTNGYNLVKSGTPVGACSGANISNNGTIKAVDAINLTLCNDTDSGTIEYNGTGGNILGGDYYNLTLSGNAAWGHINAVSGNWNVNGAFSISNGSFGMTSGEILTIKGGFSHTGGTFDSSNGAVTFMANSNYSIAFSSSKFSTLTFDNETGSNTTLTLSGSATIDSTLTVKNTSTGNLGYTVAGTSNPTLDVKGNLDFPTTAQTGTVAFGKSGSNFTTNIGGNLTLTDTNATLSAISNYNGYSGDTRALFHFNGTDNSTTFTDSSGYNSWSASGAGPVLKTTTPAPKFGTASYYNNSANYLTAADSSDFKPGSGDFTIDTWAKKQSGAGPVNSITLFDKYQDSSNYYKFTMADMPNCSPGGGSFQAQFIAVVGGVTKANYTTSCITIANDAWHHFAFVRNGSTAYIFYDGTAQTLTTATAISTNSIDNTGAERIGEQSGTTSISLDEFRFSRSAKWTANFAAPTGEYTLSPSGNDSQTITQASSINGPIIINKTSGSVALSADLTTTYTDANLSGNFTLTQGAFDANSHSLALGGNYSEAAGACSGLAGFSTAGFALSGGTFTAPTAMTVSGDYNKTGGTFTHSSGTVTFNKGSGTQTLNTGGTGAGNDLYNLTHSGGGTLQLVTGTAGIANNLLNSAGVFDGNNQGINIAGDLTSSASLLMGSGTWDVEGSVDFTGGTVTKGTSTLLMSNNKNIVGNSQTLNNFSITAGTQPQTGNPNAYAGTGANDASYGMLAWSGYTNITGSDDSYATAAYGAGAITTQYLKGTNYGFSVPSNATITGIEARVEKKGTGSSGSCTDDRVRIIKADGAIGTTDKKLGGSWATTDTISTYGSSADTWGETWTPANINDSRFGLALTAGVFGNLSTYTCSVDSINLTVYYSIVGYSTVTATDNVLVGGTLNVGSNQTLSVSSAKAVTMNAGSTTTLSGTISGDGIFELKDTAGANLSTGGTLSALTRFNTATANVTVPARTYGGKVELYNNTASNYNAVLGTGASQTLNFSSDLNPVANGNGNITVDSATNNPAVNITGNLDFTGTGGGTEIITAGSSTWTVTGNVDFTAGTFTAGTSTLKMNGTSNFNPNSQTFYNFQVAGIVGSTDSGWKSAGTGADDNSVGANAWSNYGNITADDSSYSTATINIGPGSPTDSNVKLVKGGSVTGSSKAQAGTWSDTEATILYPPSSGSSDVWGATLSDADVNSSGFGVAISAYNGATITHYLKATNFGFGLPAGATINGVEANIKRKGSSGFGTAYVNFIQMKVYYTGVTTNASVTVTDNLNVSHDLTVDTGQTLSINTAKFVTMATGTTTADNGTISGAGTLELKDTAGANLSTGGTLSCITRFNTATANVTVPARTYGGKVELYNNTGSNYNAVLGTAGSQTFTFNGDLNALASSTGNITVDSDTYDPTVNINASLDFTGAGGGTEIINAGNSTWNITGNADFTDGTLSASTSTFSFNGADSSTQVISGTNSFYNLQASTAGNTAGRTLQFAGGSTQTVTSTWTITGYSGKVITLGSTNTSAWTIAPTNTAVTYASISRSTTSALFCATYSTDGGNNTGWHISASATCAGSITISGTIYTNKNKSTNVGTGKNISLSVNGLNKSATVQTNASGQFSFAVLAATNNTLTVFIDNDPTLEANLVTQTLDGTSNITGLEMYTNRIVLRHESAGPLTNTLLDTANNCTNCGSDIHYTTSGSAASFDTAYEVIIDSAKNYTPGGNVTLGDLDINGTLAMGANSLDVSSSFDATGGTFTSSGTTTFSSTATSKTIVSASQVFGNITFNGAGGGWQFNDAASMTGNLTVSNSDTSGNGVNFNNQAINIDGNVSIGGGKLTAGSAAATVAGNWTRTAGTFVANTGGVTFDATTTGKTITSGGQSFNNLTFNGTGGEWTLQDNSTSLSLTVTAGKLIDNAKTVTVNGNIDIANTINSLVSTGSWIQGASGNISNPYNGNHIRNLSIAGSGVITTLTGNIFVGSGNSAINGGLTIGSGTLYGANKSIYFYNYASTSNLVVNNPTIGSSLGYLYYYNYANTTLNGLTLPSNFGGLVFGTEASTNSNITLNGNLSLANSNLTIWSNSSGSTQPTVYVDMGSSAIITTGTLYVGSSTYNGYLKSGTSTGHSVGGIAVGGTGTGNKLDFISSTIGVSGNVNFTGMAVNAGTSTITMNAVATGKTITSASQSFNNLTFNNAAGGWSFSDAASIAGNLTITTSETATNGVNFNNQAVNIDGNFQMDAGKLTMGSAAVTAAGNWTINGGTQVSNTSTVTFDAGATGKTIKSSSQPFNNLTFNNASGGWTFQDNSTVNANFMITAGTVAAGATTITAGGNWDSSGGTFTYNTSTVILTGASEVDNNHDLKTTGGWNKHFYNISLAATGKTTTLLAQLGVANQITLGTGTLTGAFNLVMYGTGTPMINGGATFTGVANVMFVIDTIGATVNMAGGNFGSAVFEIFSTVNNATFNLAGAVTTTGNTWLVNTSGKTGMTVNTQNNALTTTSIFFGNSSYTGAIALNMGSSTIDLGANGFYVGNNGGSHTVDLGTANITCAGQWRLVDGTGTIAQTAGGSTITMDATATGKNIYSNGQSFNNVIFNGVGGGWTLQDNATINGNLTITNGAVAAGATTITVAGNWDSSGAGATFTYGTSTVDLTGTGSIAAKTWSTITFYNLSAAYSTKTTTNNTAFLSIANSLILNGGIYSNGSGNRTFFQTSNATPLVTNGSSTITATTWGYVGYYPLTGSMTYNIGAANITYNNNGIYLSVKSGLSNVILALGADLTTNNNKLVIENAATNTTFTTSSNNYAINLGTGNFYTGGYSVVNHSVGVSINLNNSTITCGKIGADDIYDAASVTESVDLGSATINVSGDWVNKYDDGAGHIDYWNITQGTSTVNMTATATGKTITSNSQSFNNLIFNNAAGGWSFSDAASIAANLTITASETAGNGVNFNNQAIDINGNLALNGGKITAGSSNINVAGNWTNAGTFVPNTSAVIFDSTATATITGSTTFNNLTMNTATDGAKTINFTAGSTQTISGTWTLAGASGKVLTLHSTSSGSAWYFNIPASMTSGTYIDVQDSQNIANINRITPGANVTNVSNNSPGWLFGVAISGSLYDGIGGAKITAAKNIRVTVNGTTPNMAVSSSGDFTLTTSIPLAANDIVGIYVSGDTVKASTVTKVSAAGVLTGIDLFQNWTTIRHEGSITTIANTDLAIADNVADSDILFSADGSNNATYTQGLYVLTGKTYTPGANTTMTNVNIVGTFSAGATTINCSGNWDHSAGTFTRGSSTVNFTGDGSITANASTYSAPGQNFWNIAVAASSKTTTLVNHISSNTTTLGAGTLTSSGKTMGVEGCGTPFTNSANGTITTTGVVYKCAGVVNITAGTNYYAIAYNPWSSVKGTEYTAKLAGDVTVAGYINDNSNTAADIRAVIDMNGHNLITKDLFLGQNYSSEPNAYLGKLMNSGSAASLTINGKLYFANGNSTYFDADNVLDATNINTVTLSSANVGIVWDNNDDANSFIPGSSTVTFSGTDRTQNFYAGAGVTFNNLTINNTSTAPNNKLSLNENTITVNGNFTVTAGEFATNNNNLTVAGDVSIVGTFTAGSSTINCGGNWDSSVGTFTSGTSTVNLTGSGNLSTPDTTSFNNLSLAYSGYTTTQDTTSHFKTVTVGGTLTLNGGILTRSSTSNAGVFRMTSVTTPINFASPTTINNNVKLYFSPSSSGTLTIPGANYTSASVDLGAEVAGVVFELGGDFTSTYSLQFGSKISGATFNTNNHNITTSFFNFPNANWNTSLGGTGTLVAGSSTFNVTNVYAASSGSSTPVYTLDMGSSTWNVTGNWTNLAGNTTVNLTPGTSTVNLTGTAAQTITPNGQAFNNLVVNNTGTNGTANDDIISSGNLDINGNLTITDGELKLSTNNPNVTIAGNTSIAAAGSWTKGSGTVTFDGLTAATYTDSTATKQNIGAVTINKTDAVLPATNNKFTLASSMTVDTINVDGTLGSADTLDLGSLGGYILTIANVGTIADVFTTGANTVFSPGNSTVKFTATSSTTNINIPTNTFHSLQFSANEIYDMTGNLTGAFAMTGNLTIDTSATVKTRVGTTDYNIAFASLSVATTGVLDAGSSSSAITASGDWDSSAGTFTPGSSTVDLTGAGTLNAKTTGFYNINLAHNTKTTTLLADLYVSNILQMYSGGTETGSSIFLTKSNGDPITNTGATISSIVIYYPTASISIAGNAFSNNVFFRPQTNDTNFTLTSNLTTSGDIIIYNYTSGKNSTLLTNTKNISCANLYLGSAALVGTIDLSSGTHTVSGDLARRPAASSTANSANFGTGNLSVGGSINFTGITLTTGTGSQTVIMNAGATGKTITSASQAFNNLTFNGAGGGWTLQDNLMAASLTVTAGNLIDNAKTVTVNGNISIGSTANILTSSGSWIQGVSGNISNPSSTNGIYNLTIAGSGVTTTLTGSVFLGIGSLTMGPGTLNGGNHTLAMYPSINNALTVNNLVMGTPLATFHYASSTTVTQKAIILPDNFATRVYLRAGGGGNITATGNFNLGNNALLISSETTAIPANYIDMATYSLGCANLTIGYNYSVSSARNGYLKLGTNVNHAVGNISMDSGGGSSNILDLGSSTLSSWGSLDFTGISVVQGTSTTIMNSSSTGKTITSASQHFNNLTFNNATGGWSFSDAATIAGNMTVTNSETAGNGVNFNNQAINIDGNVAINGGKLTAGSSLVTVAGNWTKGSGTFATNTSTVTFDGADASTQIITGDTTFNNLTATTSGNTAGRTLQFVGASTTTISGTWTIIGYSGKVITLQSSNTTNWIVNSASSSVDYTTVSRSTNSGTNICATHSTDGGNNNASWAFSAGTSCNFAPNIPASLVQKKTTDVVIATGDWTNEASVKFTATISDQDNPDTIYLCIEKKALGVAFTNTEDNCSGSYAYSGTGVAGALTISGLVDGTQYHWQARVKDTGGLYSSWVQYGGNAESVSDFDIDTTNPAGIVNDGSSTDIDWNDGSLTQLQANWSISDTGSGIQKYEYAIQRQSDSYYWNTSGNVWQSGAVWYNNATGTNFTLTPIYLQTSVKYITSVRATDNAGNTATINSNGQQVLPTLSFSLGSTSITFDNLNAGNGWTNQKSSTISTSTNAAYGYAVGAYMPNQMKSTAYPTATVDNFYGTWASPQAWVSEFGFGYTSNDSYVQGSNRFAGGTRFAAFTPNAPGDIVADHTASVDGSTGTIANEQFNITYKIAVPSTQTASLYSTNIYYIVTANY